MPVLVLRDDGIWDASDSAAAPWAQLLRGNPLELDPASLLHQAPQRTQRAVLWSGSMAGWIHDDEPAAFDSDPRTWSPAGWTALESFCTAAAAVTSEVGSPLPRLLFRPHAAHVLSDVPSCRRFFADRDLARFGLILDPVGMLTESMLPAADDHLQRILESLAPHPATAAILLLQHKSVDNRPLAALARRLAPPAVALVTPGPD